MSRAEQRRTVSATAQYFAEMVRTLREQARLAQDEVGKRINYTGAAVSNIENCKGLPSEIRPGEVCVRDSKNPSGPSLAFRAEEWSAFLLHVLHNKPAQQ